MLLITGTPIKTGTDAKTKTYFYEICIVSYKPYSAYKPTMAFQNLLQNNSSQILGYKKI